MITVCDNCPGVSNPWQEDYDGDGTGDACDDDPLHGAMTAQSSPAWMAMETKLTEQYIYGSAAQGRVATWLPDTLRDTTAYFSANATAWRYARVVGIKRYELADHLGNVRAVITDVKRREVAGTSLSFSATVVSQTNYYAFGGMQYGRHAEAEAYRYGFNGKENDNEVKGAGNQQDYGMRVYDPRLGRFLSVDPLAPDYPELTPYQFASDQPIWAIDLDGLEGVKSNASYATDGGDLKWTPLSGPQNAL